MDIKDIKIGTDALKNIILTANYSTSEQISNYISAVAESLSSDIKSLSSEIIVSTLVSCTTNNVVLGGKALSGIVDELSTDVKDLNDKIGDIDNALDKIIHG